MTPPQIRYPLPTLVLVLVLGLVAWRGAGWARAIASRVATQWRKVAAGPPVPSSDHPRVVAGPVLRRALLLHDGTTAAATPGGPPIETIGRRLLADVYDAWPLSGPPSHYRIGTRRVFGWVAAADVLPWDTRLALRDPGPSKTVAETPGPGEAPINLGAVPLPVIDWDKSAGIVGIAAWVGGHPWEEVEGTRRLRAADVPDGSWGVLLTREELLRLLDLLGRIESAADADRARVLAIAGRLLDGAAPSPEQVAAAHAALPEAAFAGPRPSPREASERLARINEQWEPAASLGDRPAAFIPLSALP